MTIVSMAPNITDAVFYLGYGDSLAGRTSYCSMPEGAEDIPVVGSFTEMDIEKVAALMPDMVIFSGNLTDQSEEFLKNLGISYEDIRMEDIESVIEGMNKLGLMLGALDRSVAFSDSVNMLLSAERSFTSKVYVEISAKPLMAVTKHGYAGSILSTLGCNVFGEGKNPYVSAEQEDIAQFNPDIILVLSGDSKVCERNGWENISAVDNYSVHIADSYDTDLFSRPGPKLIKAIRRAGDIIEALQ